MHPVQALVSALFLALSLIVGTSAFADGNANSGRVALADGHPDSYIVQRGDTLWGIAGRFLKDPWRWQEIWRANPSIENPHLIYPGDRIELVTIDGEPRLQVGERGRPVVKLSPKVREVSDREAVPAFDVSKLKGFFELPRVMNPQEFNSAAYVLKPVGEHLIVGRGDRVYVRGLESQHGREFGIYRMGQPYKVDVLDMDSGEIRNQEIGREIVHVGKGYVERWGDPATMRIESASEQIIQGLRVLPPDPQDSFISYAPKSPDPQLRGKVINFMDGLVQGGPGQIMVLDVGSKAGVERGDVVGVFIGGEVFEDKTEGAVSEIAILPEERVGLAMIFRVYDQVSYALIMSATQAIHTGDTIATP
ncbi:MAG: LysM peptidoglycan-binding domain-containing protein [Gammaproteobacteria bacterium]|nr:LysM peptidoglycan-binding domain-containing protein [Gammaproteobacteria bacterium]MCP5136709.1 LysM peptidoglycan-binding domain-containing protein [Gammaproteobacteria bacterium]